MPKPCKLRLYASQEKAKCRVFKAVSSVRCKNETSPSIHFSSIHMPNLPSFSGIKNAQKYVFSYSIWLQMIEFGRLRETASIIRTYSGRVGLN